MDTKRTAPIGSPASNQSRRFDKGRQGTNDTFDQAEQNPFLGGVIGIAYIVVVVLVLAIITAVVAAAVSWTV